LREFETVEENLRAAMRFFGEATGSGEVRMLDGGTGIYSGLDYGVFNIAMLDGPLESLDAFERRLAACKSFFEPRTKRWSFWLCEDRIGQEHMPAAQTMLAEYRLRPISRAPGMLADGLQPPSHELPQIEIEPVANQASRQDFGDLTAVNFDIPAKISRAVYYPEVAWRGAYRGYIGRAGGRAVSMIAMVAAANSLGVYSLATRPEDRRRGYGEALLRAAVAKEQERTGIDRLILQSTEAGHKLYLRLGFRPVARFSVYLTQ
jgi:GNAT superfamily N-acetyltransferase